MIRRTSTRATCRVRPLPTWYLLHTTSGTTSRLRRAARSTVGVHASRLSDTRRPTTTAAGRIERSAVVTKIQGVCVMQSNRRCPRVTSRVTLTDKQRQRAHRARCCLHTIYPDVRVMRSDRRCPRLTLRATLTDKQQQRAHRARCCRHPISGCLRYAEQPSVSTRHITCDAHRQQQQRAHRARCCRRTIYLRTSASCRVTVGVRASHHV